MTVPALQLRFWRESITWALRLLCICAGTLAGAFGRAAQARVIVLEHATLVDGTGAAPVSDARVVIRGDRIVAAGPAATTAEPPGAERVDLAGKVVLPGLIDLHFHIEDDPRLALRQLSHGVTSFRDPGQWEEKFVELREMIASDRLPGPRIFTAGPHIDGERPAYPADAIVARDPDEARASAQRNIERGATSLKIYFRLPLASARAVIDVCKAHGIPCTAHLEILDARDLIAYGLDGVEHITSLGSALLPRMARERYRQSVLRDSDARREGRYDVFSSADLDGEEAQALYALLRQRRPWIDATLAVFEVRSTPRRARTTEARQAEMVAGFQKMQRLAGRISQAGARLVMGGHSTVPYASRGEAPWRELELLVDSGLTPLQAIHAATGEAAAFLHRASDLGTVQSGRLADVIVLGSDPVQSIGNIRSVERVMAGGEWVDVERYRTY